MRGGPHRLACAPVCAQCKRTAAPDRKLNRKLCHEPRRRQSLSECSGGAAVDCTCFSQLVVGFQWVRGLPDCADDGDASKRQAMQLSKPGGCNTCTAGQATVRPGAVSLCAQQAVRRRLDSRTSQRYDRVAGARKREQ